MNERIRLLAEQATTTEYGVDNGFDRVTFDKEKFAELIVQECAQLAEDIDGHPRARKIVLKHFGVKE